MFKNKMCFVSDYGDESIKTADDDTNEPVVEEPKYKPNDKCDCEKCAASVLYRNKQRHEITSKHINSDKNN
jgi:hypothetical protein